MKYKVLWIDDIPSAPFMDEAYESFDLEIIQKESYVEGLKWLRANQDICHAVILDVNCKEGRQKEEASSKQVFEDYLQDVISICYLQGEIKIPWFVYTAGDYEGVENLDILISKNRIWDDRKYYKKPADRKVLLVNIRKAIECLPLMQTYQSYQNVLGVFTNVENIKCVLRIIQAIEDGKAQDTSVYNDIRKALEAITEILKQKGMLPNDISGLSAATYYIRGICQSSKQNLIPNYISFCFATCEYICNEGSHNSGNTPMRVDRDTSNGDAPYLIKAAFDMLCCIAVWGNSIPASAEEIHIRCKQIQSLSIEPYKGFSKTK